MRATVGAGPLATGTATAVSNGHALIDVHPGSGRSKPPSAMLADDGCNSADLSRNRKLDIPYFLAVMGE